MKQNFTSSDGLVIDVLYHANQIPVDKPSIVVDES